MNQDPYVSTRLCGIPARIKIGMYFPRNSLNLPNGASFLGV